MDLLVKWCFAVGMERSDLLERVRALRSLPPVPVRRSIRLAAGVSQAECAEVLGVTQQGFAHWEAGTRTPSGEHAKAYLALLHDLGQAVAA
ncbi:hypothetical protein BH23ACT2_BH23ACT2_07330 [soil metagenome]